MCFNCFLWDFYMKIKQLSNEIDLRKYLKELDVQGGGISIMSAKHERLLIAIKRLHVGAANILKQDALSVGADLAVPKGTIVAEKPFVDAVLIGTKRELERLVDKEKIQPFGLERLSEYLQTLLQTKREKTQLMGIVNANDDSFYSGSRFMGGDAVAQIERMVEEGAQIIDIGAVSSRPGAAFVDEKEELERIKPIVDAIYKERLFERVRFSIDSYAPNVIEYVLDRGFGIVNDITGLESDAICKIVSSYDAGVVIMHMQGTPQTMQQNPHYEDVVDEVYAFLKERMQKAQSFGIGEIVLDVGIGFGKSLEHNIALLRHLPHFKTLQKPLLVGASRKSIIDKISPSPVERRLGGTLALHLKAVRDGADILRVHDVYEHAQALRVEEALTS